MITFRNLQEEDFPVIQEWIKSDPDHVGMKPAFFGAEGSMTLVLADAYGPCLFVRVDPLPPDSVRLHIQFGMNELRSAKTMIKAWPHFSDHIWKSGIKRMVFESRTPKLAAFCCRVFGFKRIPDSSDYELEAS